jgi:hypothetical protein
MLRAVLGRVPLLSRGVGSTTVGARACCACGLLSATRGAPVHRVQPWSSTVAASILGALPAAAITVALCDEGDGDTAAAPRSQRGPDPGADSWGVPSEVMLTNALAGKPVELSLETSRLIMAGVKLAREGELALAEGKYRQAVEQVALLDPSSDAVLVLLHKIANLCYARGK